MAIRIFKMCRLCTGIVGFALSVAGSAWGQSNPASQWVFVGSNGKLQYKILSNPDNPSTSNGDRIMDFSWAGYMGGGVSLPVVPTKQTVSPSGGDDTSAIQSAINAVSALTPDANGFRGAVLLAPGTFNISSTLNINASGVVLRGSGSGSGGSTLNMTGTTGFRAVSVQGSGSYSTSNSVNMTDSYVPSGTNKINVSSSAGFSIGDNVLITRTVTQAWIDFMGMNTLTRNGAPQTWLSVGSTFTTDRIITAISGNTITVDAPLTDSFDSKYLGSPVGTLAKYSFPGRISQDGVEHLRILAPVGTTVCSAVLMDNIIDSWMKDVVGQETQNAFDINQHAKRITMDSVINNVTTTQTRAAGTADISITGTQVLANKCQSNGTGDWPLIVAASGTGPAVALNFTTTQAAGISPHQRWYTGLLTDSSSLPNAPSSTPGIGYRDRGNSGSGQGWTVGWAVAWNVTTPYLLVQQPPGSTNWCIGCVGSEVSASEPGGSSTLLPNGIFDSLGTQVAPSSLYLAQLCERLGPAALSNIGYDSSYCVDFSLSATPGSQIVTAGGSTSYTASVSPANGFAGTVALSVSGTPSGVTATFNPTSISGGSGSSTLNVTTASTAAAGSYTLTITGTSGSLVHKTNVTLVIKPRTTTKYEAEASGNPLAGAAKVASCAGCSGGSKVGFLGNGSANTLTINNINVATAGTYTLTIYPVVSGTRTLFYSVNGGTGSSVSATGTSWSATAPGIAVPVTLKAGANTVKFYNGTAYAPDMDYITIQ